MKHTLLILAAGLLSLGASAQSDSGVQKLESTGSYEASADFIYPNFDTPPAFTGGLDRWSRYANGSSLVLNTGMEAARQGLRTGQYIVRVRFAVNADGSISDITTLGGKYGYGLEEAAINLVTHSGQWSPANIEGHDTRAWVQVPVRFHVFK